MLKQKWLKTYTGTSANQEIYNWLAENCSDLFDSITIDEDLSRVRCFSGNTEILGVTAGTSNNDSTLYWKGSSQINTVSNTSNYGYIRGIYRTTNGVFFTLLQPGIGSSSNVAKYRPGNGIIKKSDDYIGIFTSANSGFYKGSSCSNISMTSGQNSLYYKIHSANNGSGGADSRYIPGYYYNTSDKVTLTPMVCTNAEATPTEIGYWLESAMNRDVGVMTIGGHEYFSNGIFCILNE